MSCGGIALTPLRIKAAICSSEFEATKLSMLGARSFPLPSPPWQTVQRTSKDFAPEAGTLC